MRYFSFVPGHPVTRSQFQNDRNFSKGHNNYNLLTLTCRKVSAMLCYSTDNFPFLYTRTMCGWMIEYMSNRESWDTHTQLYYHRRECFHEKQSNLWWKNVNMEWMCVINHLNFEVQLIIREVWQSLLYVMQYMVQVLYIVHQ